MTTSTRVCSSTEMEPGEEPTNFVLRMNNNVSQLVGLGVMITRGPIFNIIIHGFSDECDTEGQLLSAEGNASRVSLVDGFVKIREATVIEGERWTVASITLMATSTKILGIPR